MKTLCLLLLCGSAGFAQDPLTSAVMSRYQSIRKNLIETAEAMPEDAYGFKLTPDQRTFAAWIGHTAMGNFSICSGIKGEKAPDTAGMHDMTSKADLVKAIKDSYDYCDAALSGMTDGKALAMTTGEKKAYPVQGMIALLVSGNEHYGNLVGYLRSKGIVPPSSRKK